MVERMNAENISKPINQLSAKYQDLQNRAVESARNMCTATDHYVHENPWWTIAMVAVSGIVLGLLLGQVGRSE